MSPFGRIIEMVLLNWTLAIGGGLLSHLLASILDSFLPFKNESRLKANIS